MMEVSDAPSEAQSVDIEKWRENMGSIIEMVGPNGIKINANPTSVELFKNQGYKVIKPTVKEIKKTLVPKLVVKPKPIENVVAPSKKIQ